MATRSYVDMGAMQRIESGSGTAKTSYVDMGAVQRIPITAATVPTSIMRLFEGFVVKFKNGKIILHQKQ